MKLSECMTRDPKVVDPEMTLQEAASLMGECDAGALPVGENDRLVGMVTDRDIAVRGVAQGRGPKDKVREVMSQDVCWCYEDEEVEAALERLGEEQIRRLPVLSREKRLVGIVSIGDLTERNRPAGEALAQISRPGGSHNQATTH